MRADYRIEISGWSQFARVLRASLSQVSFLQLLGKRLWINAERHPAIIGAEQMDESGVLVPLDPHLEVIAFAFSFDGATKQLPLFRALEVQS